ncbi:MAG: hypothetical protein ABI415_01655 [Flavitalea sp.]
MKSTFVILFISVVCIKLGYSLRSDLLYQKVNVPKQVTAQVNSGSGPEVRIVKPEDEKIFAWDSQVEYSISVSDPKDGDSKYGEINPNQTLLEVTYMPITPGKAMAENIKMVKSKREDMGLTLMKSSTCFGCHGDKTKVAGPSFEELGKKYAYNAATLKSLANHILKGSTGVWGNLEMPSHPDFSVTEAMQMAGYMVKEGKNKNNCVYPGLEGVLRVRAKPETTTQALYVLTASYTSKSKLRGQHSIVLKIK